MCGKCAPGTTPSKARFDASDVNWDKIPEEYNEVRRGPSGQLWATNKDSRYRVASDINGLGEVFSNRSQQLDGWPLVSTRPAVRKCYLLSELGKAPAVLGFLLKSEAAVYMIAAGKDAVLYECKEVARNVQKQTVTTTTEWI